MRLLHIADVHLERSFKWLGYHRGNARRQELRNALTRVVECARDRQVDALCIAGDLFERENATPAVGEFLGATFEKLKPIPVLIAPGNHDYFRPGCLYDRTPWPTNVHVFREAQPRPFPLANGVIWGMAFDAPERRTSPLANFRAPDDGLHLGLFHADVVDGGEPSIYGPLDPSEPASSGLEFAMLGHIHAGRVDEVQRLAYPGSLEPLDVAEVGPRWALLVDVARSGRSIERIEIARRRVISAEIDVSSISTLQDLQCLLDQHRPNWQDNDVRLRVIGTLHGELLARPDAIRRAIAEFDVDLRLEASPAEDLDSLARQRTTLGMFVREARERIKDSETDERRRYWEDVLATGIAAFRGQEVILR
jgi:exonuclease SbcD